MKLNKLFKKFYLLRNSIEIQTSEIKEKYKWLPPSAMLTLISSKLWKEYKKLQKLEFKIHQSLYENKSKRNNI